MTLEGKGWGANEERNLPSALGEKSDIDNDNLRDPRCPDGGTPGLDAACHEEVHAIL